MRSHITSFMNKAYTGVHQHARHLLPRWQHKANGVPYTGRLGDAFNFVQPAGNPYYECGLVESIRYNVEEDDDVRIVGGGHGITSLAAERQGGRVTVYEPSPRLASKLCRRVSGTVVCEGFYEDKNVYGDGTTRLTGADLDACDVLVLDCEGVEHKVIRDLTESPRVIVVETHGFLGAPKDVVWEEMSKIGFDVSVVALQDKEKGVWVLEGVKSE